MNDIRRAKTAIATILPVLFALLLCLPAKAQTYTLARAYWMLTCNANSPCEPAALHITTYRTHGPGVLNDLTVTPGAVRPGATVAQLCDPNFHTGTVRNVTEATKKMACAEYGLSGASCTGKTVEIDHLISLELGGSNELANLWPQPYAPRPGAKEKDVVENWLHRQVCSQKMSLADAQHQISTDWYAIYLTVPKANGGGAQ